MGDTDCAVIVNVWRPHVRPLICHINCQEKSAGGAQRKTALHDSIELDRSAALLRARLSYPIDARAATEKLQLTFPAMSPGLPRWSPDGFDIAKQIWQELAKTDVGFVNWSAEWEIPLF